MMIRKTNHTITTNTGERLTIAIGDVVGFKCDVEQYGKVTEITPRNSRGGLDVTVTGEFVGEYIGGRTIHIVDARDCWKD